MSYEIDTLDVSLKAHDNLSTYQYCYVKISADNEVDICGAGEAAFGILQNKPSVAGYAARVRVFGVSRLVASAAIAAGAKVMSAASGQGVTSDTDKDIFNGLCLEHASFANELCTVLLTGQQTLSK